MRKSAMAGLAGMVFLLSACEEGAEGPPAPDPDVVALGRQVYQRNCASCHGAQGEGAITWKERNEFGELPPPPHDSTGHTWMHSDSLLYQLVYDGWRDPFNKTDRLTMPAFQGILSPSEIRAVITYLKTLWFEEQQQFQWQESQDEPFPDGTA